MRPIEMPRLRIRVPMLRPISPLLVLAALALVLPLPPAAASGAAGGTLVSQDHSVPQTCSYGMAQLAVLETSDGLDVLLSYRDAEEAGCKNQIRIDFYAAEDVARVSGGWHIVRETSGLFLGHPDWVWVEDVEIVQTALHVEYRFTGHWETPTVVYSPSLERDGEFLGSVL